jgi:NAD(P)-dependent dehydrogenase (short-subunit alcohol dehydrogenase family)
VALVTGGAVRVGRAIALALGRAGLDVAIGYHRSTAAARTVVLELRALGVRGAAVRADLRSPTGGRRLVGETIRRFGRLDVLVNNAALFFATPLAATTPAQYDRLLDLNLRGPFLCAQAAAAHMRVGWIVNVGDAAADRAWPHHIPYAVSKAGVVALTRGLAAALAPRIAVNCVAPGPVLRPPGLALARWRRQRRGHSAGPQDVAAAVVYFATCPRAITGQVLAVGAS